MTESVLITDISGPVATVILNRPDVHNAFNHDLISALQDSFEDIAARDDVSVMVLRGAGKTFSAGADLNWMREAADYDFERNFTDALALANMLRALDALPCLSIALAQGAAMGGGLGLLACCDMVIAETNTKFSLSEVKLGLVPATISPYVLRAIGERQARRYFQTGERFDAETARIIGLVHDVADDLDVALQAILASLAQNGPQAMRDSKRLCHDYAGQKIDDTIINDSARRIATIRTTNEAKEGIAAFLEKRSPAWKK
jgi:methylglutaconyl-CoA hydratase